MPEACGEFDKGLVHPIFSTEMQNLKISTSVCFSFYSSICASCFSFHRDILLIVPRTKKQTPGMYFIVVSHRLITNDVQPHRYSYMLNRIRRPTLNVTGALIIWSRILRQISSVRQAAVSCRLPIRPPQFAVNQMQYTFQSQNVNTVFITDPV